jgi:photosystem II stability/assembly factor-like uncharacterized protein
VTFVEIKLIHMRILAFILWIGFALLPANFLFAQFQFESSKEYGQLLDIRYSPTTQNLLFARSVNNHILKSTDGGENWTIIRSLPQENNFVQVRELKITADGNHLTYICQAEGTAMNRVEVMNVATEQVVKSIYSPIGEISGSLIQSYSFAKNNSDIALFHTTRFINWGLVTEIFYTQDGGTNWNSVYFSPSNGDISVNNVAISPFNTQKLYLMRGPSPSGIEGGMLISEDAGQSWEEQINGLNLNPIAFHPTNQNILYVGSFYLGPDQTQQLYRTTNNGMSWVVLPVEWTDLSTNSIHDILINPNNDQNIVVLEENEIAISEDGGGTWETHVYGGENFEEYYYGVNGSFNPFVNNQLIISANYYPFISNDGGETLTKLETPFVNSTGTVGYFDGENQHLYYGVRNGFVHKDLQTQEETPIGLVELGFTSNSSFMGPFIDPLVEGRLFFGYSNWMGNASIMMSTDHGADPLLIHSNSYIFLMGMDTYKNNPNLILMSFGELVYKFDLTNLDAIVQTEISLPSFGIVDRVMFGQNENEFLFIVNNKLYKSTNNGANWVELNNGLEGLASEFMFDLAKNPLNESQLALATSLGIFLSEDGGQTWTHSFEGQSYHKLKFSDQENGVLLANSRFEDGAEFPSAHSQLVYTKNNGETWEEISTDVFGFLRTMKTEIVFHDNDTATAYFLTPDLGLVSYEVDLEILSLNDESIIEFSLYPNPNQGIFHVKSQEKVEKIEVYNFQGQKLKEMKNGNWNFSELPKGIYLLKIHTEKGKIQFRKMIKN